MPGLWNRLGFGASRARIGSTEPEADRVRVSNANQNSELRSDNQRMRAETDRQIREDRAPVVSSHRTYIQDPPMDDIMQKLLLHQAEMDKEAQAFNEALQKKEQELKDRAEQDELDRQKILVEQKEEEEQRRILEQRAEKEHAEALEATHRRWDAIDRERQKIFDEDFNVTEEEIKRNKAETASIKERANEEIERIREQRRLDSEKNRRAFQEYCGNLRAQFANFIMMLRLCEWNKQIENKWTERLSGLKDWFTPIHESFNALRIQLEFGQTDKSKLEIISATLTEKLVTMTDVMDQEVEDMERLAIEKPDALFLADIKESARAVGQAALKLLDDVLLFMGEDGNRAEKWMSYMESYKDLENKVYLIPTVHALKEKYQA